MVHMDGNNVVNKISHASKGDLRINGGYFVLRKDVFDYMKPGEELVEEPFQRLIDKKLLSGLPLRRLLREHGHVQGAPGTRGDVRDRQRPRGPCGPRGAREHARAFARRSTLCSPARRPQRRHRDRLWGNVLQLLARNPGVAVHWVVFSAQANRAGEAEASAARFLASAKLRSVEVHQFRDGFFPSEHARIKTYFEELKAKGDPDLIFTHYRDDLHQDHRVVSELTWNTYRRHTVLEYEVPKWDGDLGNPNVYVPLSEDEARRKVEILIECFGTQRGKHWFDQRHSTASCACARSSAMRSRSAQKHSLAER
jgi:LmbE family N-acetylglucosaminyl deacetylase